MSNPADWIVFGQFLRLSSLSAIGLSDGAQSDKAPLKVCALRSSQYEAENVTVSW